jgi:phosphohistidine phosphatase
MLRSLTLIRHAESHINHLCEDFDRDLTEKGYEQAKKAGLFLSDKRVHIDKALCSPATRAYKTYQTISNFITVKELELSRHIYDGTKNFLYNLIISQDDEYKSLMLIGHNPTISELVLSFFLNDTDDLEILPTSALIILLYDELESWRDLGTVIISDFYKYDAKI